MLKISKVLHCQASYHRNRCCCRSCYACHRCLASVYQLVSKLFWHPANIKLIYLGSVTSAVIALILGPILYSIFGRPYLLERRFHAAKCQMLKWDLPKNGLDAIQCENKCSKVRSTFPCINILVRFQIISAQISDFASKNISKVNLNQAFLFDDYKSFENDQYRHWNCALRPCFNSQNENLIHVLRFAQLLEHRYGSLRMHSHYQDEHDHLVWFSCYVLSNMSTGNQILPVRIELATNAKVGAVILFKHHSRRIFLLTIYCPCLSLAVSLLLLFIVYRRDHCLVWIKTKDIFM